MAVKLKSSESLVVLVLYIKVYSSLELKKSYKLYRSYYYFVSLQSKHELVNLIIIYKNTKTF